MESCRHTGEGSQQRPLFSVVQIHSSPYDCFFWWYIDSIDVMMFFLSIIPINSYDVKSRKQPKRREEGGRRQCLVAVSS